MQARPHTNPLGPGTRNFVVNWPTEELEQLGRMASASGQSLGGLIKQMVRRQMLAETRRALRAGVLLALFLGLTAAQWMGCDDVDVRRARASVRVRRNEA